VPLLIVKVRNRALLVNLRRLLLSIDFLCLLLLVEEGHKAYVLGGPCSIIEIALAAFKVFFFFLSLFFLFLAACSSNKNAARVNFIARTHAITVLHNWKTPMSILPHAHYVYFGGLRSNGSFKFSLALERCLSIIN